ncbi:mitochondrial carrier [Gonapodya prolifera JEL478]|uniref:Mitochondrial carrier n=1 Tax=Gonapodya prolifera (strain JEL478) TaxID=1344416 RepID=A0A139A712_GONPJ|nr:mitochondrial carrier [Gonapodya prolifera JEL478]|eukprot:KXS12616.1 mitochondrial carrier [Gonapodya prolifera JEL478]
MAAVDTGREETERTRTGADIAGGMWAEPNASSGALATLMRSRPTNPDAVPPAPLCPSDPPLMGRSMSTTSPATAGASSRTAPSSLGLGVESEPRHRNKRSLDYIVRSLVAGGVAGSVAKTVIAPLDRVKILFQTSNPKFQRHIGSFTGFFHAMREIHAEYGVRGLFQGHSATLLRIFPYAAIKFMAFEQYKHWLMPTTADETGLRHLYAGSLAGVTSVYFTYPLELVRVRMAFSTQKRRPNILGTVRRIYHEPNTVIATYSPTYRNLLISEASGATSSAGTPHFNVAILEGAGAEGGRTATLAQSRTLSYTNLIMPVAGVYNFYRGFLPTVYGMIPYAGISFWTYESVSQLLRNRFSRWTLQSPEEAARKIKASKRDSGGKAPLNTPAQLFAGAVAGAFAQTCSYPLEVVRRQMQVAGSSELRELRTQLAAGAGPEGLVDVRHKSTWQTAKGIWVKSGSKGFFVGLSIGYIKVTPMVAVSFVVYERMKAILDIE